MLTLCQESLESIFLHPWTARKQNQVGTAQLRSVIRLGGEHQRNKRMGHRESGFHGAVRRVRVTAFIVKRIAKPDEPEAGGNAKLKNSFPGSVNSGRAAVF